MTLKKLWFSVRDGVRFKTAKAKYDFLPSGTQDELDFHQFKHIVILKIDSKLGDTEAMSHFYQNLRALPQQPCLSVVCQKNLVPIYRDILGFDQVLESSAKPKFKEIQRLCQQLAQGYASYKQSQQETNVDAEESLEPCVDLLVTTEPHFRPRDFIFNSLLKPRFVAGCESHVNSVNYLLYKPDEKSPKVSECFVEFMRAGQLHPSAISYQPFVTQETLQNMRVHMGLAADHPQRKIIGLNPLASSFERSFTPEMTAALIHDIQAFAVAQDQEIYIMLLCPPAATEFKHYINTHCNVTQLLQLPPHSSALDYASAIHLLDALITVDTAAVHLACASDIPQLCFYTGASNEVEALRWAPIGEKATVVRYEGMALSNLEAHDVLSKVHDFFHQYL